VPGAGTAVCVRAAHPLRTTHPDGSALNDECNLEGISKEMSPKEAARLLEQITPANAVEAHPG
jgi:hypothetical protein